MLDWRPARPQTVYDSVGVGPADSQSAVDYVITRNLQVIPDRGAAVRPSSLRAGGQPFLLQQEHYSLQPNAKVRPLSALHQGGHVRE